MSSSNAEGEYSQQALWGMRVLAMCLDYNRTTSKRQLSPTDGAWIFRCAVLAVYPDADMDTITGDVLRALDEA